MAHYGTSEKVRTLFGDIQGRRSKKRNNLCILYCVPKKRAKCFPQHLL